MAYAHPTYVLLCDNTFLLALNVEAMKPELAVGQDIQPYNIETGEAMGWFYIERIRRRLPYRNLTIEEKRGAFHGEEIHVHVRKL